VTWWQTEETRPDPMASGTRARQRWDQLRAAVLDIVEPTPLGARFACRWIMSGWQVWRRIDREWCEYVCDATDRNDAVRTVNFSVDDTAARG